MNAYNLQSIKYVLRYFTNNQKCPNVNLIGN